MSLKEARQIAKRVSRAGARVRIIMDKAACLARNPNMHKMAG